MNQKEYLIDQDILVRVIKKKRSKNIRLTIENNGSVRVSIPLYLPYSAGLAFAKSRIKWIVARRKKPELITNETKIGKSHRLYFENRNTNRISTKIKDLNLYVYLPLEIKIESLEAQKAASRIIRKALIIEANNLLPQRVEQLASKYNFTYRDVSIKHTKSRWGACDKNKSLTFNPNLMQLAWELIDYVIIHELSHTIHMHHQQDFWNEVERCLPEYKKLRKELKSTKTI